MALRVARWLGIAALVIGYALLAHYANDSPKHGGLGVAVAVAPLALIAIVLAWRSSRRFIMLGTVTALCVALWAGWSTLEHHVGLVFWLQHTGMQLILLVGFGRTLVSGRQPLCTRFAAALHAPLTPQQEVYTRQVTAAWTLFFAAMTVASTALFFLTPLSTWSIFANFLTMPLVALMFIVEYGVRRRALPDMRHMHILDAVRAFWKTSVHP